MRDFPRLVFTSPGPNKCNGGTYGHELVQNETEVKAALEEGFFESIPEALEALKNPKKVAEKIEDSKEPEAIKTKKTAKAAK